MKAQVFLITITVIGCEACHYGFGYHSKDIVAAGGNRAFALMVSDDGACREANILIDRYAVLLALPDLLQDRHLLQQIGLLDALPATVPAKECAQYLLRLYRSRRRRNHGFRHGDHSRVLTGVLQLGQEATRLVYQQHGLQMECE